MSERLFQKAMELGSCWGYDEQEVEALGVHLARYKACKNPYNSTCSVGGCREWWEQVMATHPETTPLAALAIRLWDAVPHAAGPEWVFSRMGWFHSNQRFRLSLATNVMLTSVQLDMVGSRSSSSSSSKCGRKAADATSSEGMEGSSSSSSSIVAPTPVVPQLLFAPHMPPVVAATAAGMRAVAAAENNSAPPMAVTDAELMAELDYIAAVLAEEAREAGDKVPEQPPFGCCSWVEAVQLAANPLSDLFSLDLCSPGYQEVAVPQGPPAPRRRTVRNTSTILQRALQEEAELAAATWQQQQQLQGMLLLSPPVQQQGMLPLPVQQQGMLLPPPPMQQQGMLPFPVQQQGMLLPPPPVQQQGLMQQQGWYGGRVG
jgi:hypothetical protein